MTGTPTTRLDRKNLPAPKPAEPPADDAPPPPPSSDTTASTGGKRSRRRWGLLTVIAAFVVAAVLGTVFLVQSTAHPSVDPVAVTVPVALSDAKVPDGTKIGIVLTLGQGAEGAEWAEAAQGAEVAKYRLGLGGTKIDLVVEDDHGTASGAKDAVTALVKKDVTGIVLASEGPHLHDAVTAAGEAGVPTVLPYAPLPADAAKNVWSLAPTDTMLADAMNSALAHFTHPLLLKVGGSVPDGLHVAETLQAQGTDVATLATTAAARTGANPTANGAYTGGQQPSPDPTDAPSTTTDALVIAGAPAQMAEMVAALQARQVTVPILLAPSATSPMFTQTLNAKGGTVSSALRTFSVNAGDSTALGRTNTARGMSAFLQAIEQLADGSDAKNLTGDAAFAQVAPWADTCSHDAVLALVHAVAAAGTTEPSRVNTGMGRVRLDASSGGAGPALDFSTANPTSGNVQMLYATGQSLGLRPTAPDTLELAWFPQPHAKS